MFATQDELALAAGSRKYNNRKLDWKAKADSLGCCAEFRRLNCGLVEFL